LDCDTIVSESEGKKMKDLSILIDFVIENAKWIERYEIEDFDGESEINFFMEDGDVETFIAMG
jgi:hypothetical protein